MDVSFFQEILSKISDRGRQILDLSSLIGTDAEESFEELCQALVSSRGEASGVALARRILDLYRLTTDKEKDAFFVFLARHFLPSTEAVQRAATAYLEQPEIGRLETLMAAVESPRQELFRRLNLAPGGTTALVRMREDLLRRLKDNPQLAGVDRDFVHLFSSWFNRGFLVLAHLSWSSPASILEKLIVYEKVHKIHGFEDLRRRLDPNDRRCFAFFHPALVDEPLIFVQVALASEIPSSIQLLLASDAEDFDDPDPSVAVFYSISNCQDGLRGISFGNFLIKQVAEDMKKEKPSLKTFVTLSPAPTFRSWLEANKAELSYLPAAQRKLIDAALAGQFGESEEELDALEPAILAAAAHYYLRAKDKKGKPVDPVARFHLGNGARLERINWLGDTSEKGIRESLSVMVNYLYDLKDIERNHEAYVNLSQVAASKAVRSILLAPEPNAKAAQRKSETIS
ncbi:malonyl-CoA decarboxylase [Rhodomicrobium vannielii ATCC 17100]|nr:malonyl-CoA decarboxylase [Rhodomicrobium vannielii]MBJ7533039.1 malonyl-CoA decarboxylase [Rhodomicrobium vannielii ATCC 17100]